MAATATKKETSVEEKLDALYELQKIDSEIDRIRTIRGELPLEVQDLEDELEGLETRLNKLQDAKKDAEVAIVKYKEQQNNVRNNREFESLDKEIEFQELEIKLHDKRIKESKFTLANKKELLDVAKVKFDLRKGDLAVKKAELDEIIAETQTQEDVLNKKSTKAKSNIEERLTVAYNRLRQNAKNGLAVVLVDRDACGGCFNKIPPQRQSDIKTKRKIIVCEHCGRILVPQDIA